MEVTDVHQFADALVKHVQELFPVNGLVHGAADLPAVVLELRGIAVHYRLLAGPGSLGPGYAGVISRNVLGVVAQVHPAEEDEEVVGRKLGPEQLHALFSGVLLQVQGQVCQVGFAGQQGGVAAGVLRRPVEPDFLEIGIIGENAFRQVVVVGPMLAGNLLHDEGQGRLAAHVLVRTGALESLFVKESFPRLQGCQAGIRSGLAAEIHFFTAADRIPEILAPGAHFGGGIAHHELGVEGSFRSSIATVERHLEGIIVNLGEVLVRAGQGALVLIAAANEVTPGTQPGVGPGQYLGRVPEVVGSQLAPAVVELDAFAKPESPLGQVFIGFPLVGQFGHVFAGGGVNADGIVQRGVILDVGLAAALPGAVGLVVGGSDSKLETGYLLGRNGGRISHGRSCGGRRLLLLGHGIGSLGGSTRAAGHAGAGLTLGRRRGAGRLLHLFLGRLLRRGAGGAGFSRTFLRCAAGNHQYQQQAQGAVEPYFGFG